jgi:hypothetical protein
VSYLFLEINNSFVHSPLFLSLFDTLIYLFCFEFVYQNVICHLSYKSVLSLLNVLYCSRLYFKVFRFEFVLLT